MVLTHLILNDMMKVKGHVARLALCLQDSDFRVASLAQLFFHELSNKAYKVGHIQADKNHYHQRHAGDTRENSQADSARDSLCNTNFNH